MKAFLLAVIWMVLWLLATMNLGAATYANYYTTNANPPVGIATNLYANSLVRYAYYVDGSNGSDSTGDGSSGKPWASLDKAQSESVVGSSIYVLSGTYTNQITRGGVVWIFSRGSDVVSFVATNPVISCTQTTNYVFLGEGSFRNVDGGAVIDNATVAAGAGCDIEFQARYLLGPAQIAVNYTRTNRIYFRDMLWEGSGSSIGDAEGGFGADIQFTNVKSPTADFDGGFAFKFTVVGCVTRVTPSANANRVGTWLVNPNVPLNLNWP